MQDDGIAFLSDTGNNQDDTGRGDRGGWGGRVNYGFVKDGQYSGHGGRGKREEQSNEAAIGGEEHNHMVDNVNKEVNDYSTDYTMTNYGLSTLTRKWLLLDSCSTSDLISTTHL